jgi:hypothetical protein
MRAESAATFATPHRETRKVRGPTKALVETLEEKVETREKPTAKR